MDLRRLSISSYQYEDERNIGYLLQNAKLLEELDIEVDHGRSLVGLLSLSARTLKTLYLWTTLSWDKSVFLGGICEELEAMAGHNMLEALTFQIRVVERDTEEFIGSIIQKVENVLVKPGWSMLRQVSFELQIFTNRRKLCEALQSLPDKYLSHLSKLESVAFSYSARAV